MSIPQDIELKLRTLRQKLAVLPCDPVLHNQLGIAMGAAGQVNEALAAFDQAIQYCPTYGEALLNRGLVLEILNREPAAFDAFAAAAHYTPMFLEAEARLSQFATRHPASPALKSRWPRPRTQSGLAR